MASLSNSLRAVAAAAMMASFSDLTTPAARAEEPASPTIGLKSDDRNPQVSSATTAGNDLEKTLGGALIAGALLIPCFWLRHRAEQREERELAKQQIAKLKAEVELGQMPSYRESRPGELAGAKAKLANCMLTAAGGVTPDNQQEISSLAVDVIKAGRERDLAEPIRNLIGAEKIAQIRSATGVFPTLSLNYAAS